MERKPKKVQTAFRFDDRLYGRLKEAARQADTSVNEYVTLILSKATADIRTAEDLEEARKKTMAFADSIFGKWQGSESPEEIMENIRGGRIENEIEAL